MWLAQTDGLDSSVGIAFVDLRSAEFVLNRMGEALFGADSLRAGGDEKQEALTAALRELRLAVVRNNNFEVAVGIKGIALASHISAAACRR